MHRVGFLLVVYLFLSGCSTIAPSFTFKVISDPVNASNIKFVRHPTSQIAVKKGKVLRLTVESVFLTALDESSATSKGEVGNREILIYAKIYRNGQFVAYKMITDIAEHMAVYQPAIVQNPNIFTETIDGYYRIELKAYEVDTKNIVKLLRRIKNVSLDSLEGGPYSPGETFATGFKDIIFGAFDVLLSITGRSLDGWVAKINATKLIEHSIYITANKTDGDSNRLLVLGSGDNSYFIEQDKFTDTEISAGIDAKLVTIEANSHPMTDFINHKLTLLNKSAYIVLGIERL